MRECERVKVREGERVREGDGVREGLVSGHTAVAQLALLSTVE